MGWTRKEESNQVVELMWARHMLLFRLPSVCVCVCVTDDFHSQLKLVKPIGELPLGLFCHS